MPTITAFERSPDQGRGLARDMRVRWALEETGQAYDVRLLTFPALKQPTHRALQPFGQIPTYEDDGVMLFESGAIVLYIAEHAPATDRALLPSEPAARARALSWLFAAIATVEPPVVEYTMAMLFEREQVWFSARQVLLAERVHQRLNDLSAHLVENEWLDGAFSAGDLMMVTVLRRLQSSGLLAEHPKVAAYVARGEARLAFQRALSAQRAVFLAAPP